MNTTVTKDVEFAGTQFKVCGPEKDAYFSELYNHMIGNTFFHKVLTNYVRPGSTVIDVGANIGVTTAMMAKIIPGARIIAIEPGPFALECLRETMTANKITEVTALDVCISDHCAPSIKLHESGGNLSASHIIAADHPTIGSESGTSVKVKTLDSVVDELALDRVDFVKIDVEGFEIDVLKGMSRIASRFAPLIFMEFNSWTLVAYRNISPRVLLDYVHDTFGTIHYMRADESIGVAQSRNDLLGFLCANMIQHGCVDDIMFSSDPKRLVPSINTA